FHFVAVDQPPSQGVRRQSVPLCTLPLTRSKAGRFAYEHPAGRLGDKLIIDLLLSELNDSFNVVHMLEAMASGLCQRLTVPQRKGSIQPRGGWIICLREPTAAASFLLDQTLIFQGEDFAACCCSCPGSCRLWCRSSAGNG